MKEMKIVATETAPAAIGPYSQAIIYGDIVFTSGQIAINPATGNIEAEGIEAQAEQVMKNLGEVLKAAGSDFTKAIKTTCFLADMGDFAALCNRVNELQDKLMKHHIICEHINVGGGLGIDYGHPNHLPIPNFAEYFATYRPHPSGFVPGISSHRKHHFGRSGRNLRCGRPYLRVIGCILEVGGFEQGSPRRLVCSPFGGCLW